MLSPHPSYPPLEAAQSGMWTVTTEFSNKVQERFSGILIMKKPDTNSLLLGLIEALELLRNGEAPSFTSLNIGQNLDSAIYDMHLP
jgi:hypothetical protein